MSIGFVIVTYNSARILPACLKSIAPGFEVVVVDNASRDDSAGIACSLGARVIANKKNAGFGAACNQGANLLLASHVFFLNPDAILATGAVAEIEKAIELYPEAGGFGPAIEVTSKKQKFRKVSYPQSRGARLKPDFPPSDTAEVDFLDGAALVCDLQLFRAIGGFDERIFLYFEDDDLCYRVRAQNRKLIYLPSAKVFHQRNGSSGSSLHLDYLRSFHASRSRIFVSWKYDIPLDLKREQKRASFLLLRSLITLNVRKVVKVLGTLFGLRQRC
jgi:N-acetylglucosaminyl-diphospho-decaprenol L-rhamnosyltransferase